MPEGYAKRLPDATDHVDPDFVGIPPILCRRPTSLSVLQDETDPQCDNSVIYFIFVESESEIECERT